MDRQPAQIAIDHLVAEHHEQLEQISGVKLVSPDQFKQIVAQRDAAAVETHTVDLEGWDTASVVTFEMMNNSIVLQKTSPSNFEYLNKPDGVSIKGSFGDWKLALSGGGANIALSVPITEGEYTFNGIHTLGRCEVQIQVNAKYYPHAGDPSQQKLTVNTQAAVTVMSITPPPKDSLQEGVVKQMLENWFNTNLGVFQPVFATVDLGAKYESQVAWMKPAYTSYAVNVPEVNPTMTNSVFGVVTLIDDGQPSSSTTSQLSPYVLPEGSAAAFALSRGKVLKHYYLPAVHLMFQNATPDDFSIDNDDGEITNKTKLQLHPTELDNGKVVSPEVDAEKFKLAVNDEYLRVELTDISFPVGGILGMGLTLKLDYAVSFQLALDEAGTLTLVEVAKSASVDSHLDEAKWLIDAKIGLAATGLVLCLVGAVAGVAGKAASAAEKVAAIDAAADAADVASVSASSLSSASSSAASIATEVEQVSKLTQVLGAVGKALKLSEMGIPFSAIAKYAAGAGTVAMILDGVQEIKDLSFAKSYKDKKLEFKKTMQDAIDATVIWPEGVDKLERTSVQLRNSMVFGYSRKDAKGA